MNGNDSFESELKAVKPAAPPSDFMMRLRALETAQPQARVERPLRRPNFWESWLRLLLPATALIALAILVIRAGVLPHRYSNAPPSSHTTAASPRLKADDVEIDRQLVSSFDAIARLPGGETVRFQCREWVDEVVWRDKTRGLTVEQRAPRLEVIPVRFETD